MEYKLKMELKMKHDAAKVDEHKEMLAKRKLMFEEEFATVWGKSVTEISIATITLDTPEMAEKLIAALYNKTLVADVQNFFNVPRY